MADAQCRSCRSSLLVTILDLGRQAACDAFPRLDDPDDEPVWPLRAVVCTACGLVQLGGDDAPIPQPPRAVESRSHREHAARTARAVARGLGLGQGATVREFASHHGGSWLPTLRADGLRVLESGRADLVVDVHGLPHEPDLEAALAQRSAAAADDGVLVLEFHHLLPLLVEGQFDTVRHGHSVYLSLSALLPAFARHGWRAVDASPSAVFGGSLVVTATRRGDVPASPAVAEVLEAERRAGVTDPRALAGLQDRARESAGALHAYLESARRDGRVVLGYGAPSKASVLLTVADVDSRLLPFTADLSPDKHGCRLPGVGIPIRSPQDLLDARPDDVLVLTWDIADEVVAQLPEVTARGGRFVVPAPQLRSVGPVGSVGSADPAGAPHDVLQDAGDAVS